MPILTSDNRDITNGAKYSFLSSNYASGVSSIIVENTEEFKPNDFVLLGSFGGSSTEIRRISSITTATDTLVLNEATSFPHTESTRVIILSYNQVRFFHGPTTTFTVTDPVKAYVLLGTETTQFDITNPSGTTFRYTYDSTGIDPHLSKYIQVGYTIVINATSFNSANNGTYTVTSVDTNYFEVTNASGVVESNKTIGSGSIKVDTNYQDIDTSSVFSRIRDIVNSTGFGWFVFFNSYTGASSQNSNAIPYAGFAENSVRSILDSFFSLLNNKELKLITREEAFSWLNEAYSIAQNELNLVNKEYNGETETDISIVSGTAEYSLPTNFGDLLSVVTSGGVPVGKIDISDVSSYNTTIVGGNSTSIRYYLRDNYIGFAPTPTSTATYKMRHTGISSTLTSMYDNVEFPDNNFYCIKDYMLFRAATKLSRTDGPDHYKIFFDSIERMKNTSITRDTSTDSWYVSDGSNI